MPDHAADPCELPAGRLAALIRGRAISAREAAQAHIDRIRLVRRTRGGYVLESYNHMYPARVVAQKDVIFMHVILYSRRRDF